MQFIALFLDISKAITFWWKNANVSRTQDRESSPRRMGKQFYCALVDFKFSPNSGGGGGVLRNGGLEFSTLFLGVKKDKVSQSLFAYQVKFNFSIKNIFSKEYCDIKDTLICKVNSNLKLP